MRKVCSVLAVLVVGLLGCSGGPSPDQSPLYFFGTDIGPDSFQHAGYWNSGSRTNFAEPDTESSDAIVFDSAVTVSGVRKNVGGYDQACLWIDGSFSALVDSPAADSWAGAIRQSGSSTYTAGSLAYGVTGAGYWKGHTAKGLPDGSTTFDALEYGSWTYAFGYYWVAGPSWVACYWKIDSMGAATRHDLPEAGDGRYLRKGTLDGSAYYIPCQGGYCIFTLGADTASFVALTGAHMLQRVTVTPGGPGSAVRAVGTSDSSGSDKACLWVDGIATFTETVDSEAFDVLEWEGKTYLCGTCSPDASFQYACYWEDGVRHQLSTESGTSSHTILLIQ